MVATGENFIGSQFFFTLGPDLASLDGVHCVIGEVVEGHEVLRQLNESIVDDKHRPYKDIRITHTVVLEDPYADPRGFKPPSRSPSPSADRLKNGRIAADEDIDDTQGKTEAEVQEMLQEREAKARATILEIVGDIPDADVAPPENVLFVCKLNPVTNDDDLQIIFSRFGKIKTCEVIRDKSSGDSLQYAFIEFEEQKSCEDAYFKMDNVLIDDRRIHVDFSQSVSKIKWRGKGNYTIHDDSNQFKSEKAVHKAKRSGINAQRWSKSPRWDQRNDPDRRTDYDSRRRTRSPRKRTRSPRRRSPVRRSSPARRDRYSPRRRSRSRSRDRRPRDYSPARRSRSRSRDRKQRAYSPKRRSSQNRRRVASPRRPRSVIEAERRKKSQRSASQDSYSSREDRKKKKSSHKRKKKSSKKSKKRHRSTSSSSSSSSDSSRDYKKKSRR